MRDYAKVSPQFWTRGSGKKLRGDADAQVLALFLVTCPSAHMVGVYYVPLVSIAHETGLGPERTAAALERLAVAGFAFYDTEAELVWVPNMASYQIGDELKDGDKRRGGFIRSELDKIGRHKFVSAFWDRYGAGYGLGPCPFDAPSVPLPVVADAPSMGHLAQSGRAGAGAGEEQEQEQTTPSARDERPDQVWEHYVATLKRYRPRRRPTVLGPKDRKGIRDLLRSGLTVSDLKAAVNGMFKSPWHMGISSGTEYLEIKYAIKNATQFMSLADEGEPPAPKPDPDEIVEYVDPALIDAELEKLDRRFAS